MSSRLLEERMLTESDHLQLTRLLERDGRGSAPFASLRDVLDGAHILTEAELAPDVVTMYSRVQLVDGAGDARRSLTLCYPADADAVSGYVSVLSPIGSGLLGLRAGCVATWRTPDGAEAAAEIADVLFQPEAHRAGGRADGAPLSQPAKKAKT